MSEIEEIMAEALRDLLPEFDYGDARAILSALEAKGWVVVKRSVGVIHQQEVFLSEKK